MQTNVSSTERVKRCINLGITDQRCDQYEMINIVRNIKPSLISLATATRSLDHDTLTILAETVLLAERRYIHKFRNDNSKENEWVNELYADFAKQLGLKSEGDIKDFKVAGLALMLSDDLNPHVDGMNPKGLDDLTIMFNFQINIAELDAECQDAVRASFGDKRETLPFTLILYPRRCLVNYGNKIKAIKEFPAKCLPEKKGREALIQVLNDVGSTLDYNSRCFTTMGYGRRDAELSHPENSGEYIFAKAAVDKMVSWFLIWFYYKGHLRLTHLVIIYSPGIQLYLIGTFLRHFTKGLM